MSLSPRFAVEVAVSATRPMPDADEVDVEEAHRRLDLAKGRVRLAIDSVGERAWSSAVHQPVPAWKTRVPRPASRAYYKMWEMVHTCVLAPSTSSPTSWHLCEAPGGFVQACRELVPGLEWWASSVRDGPRFAVGGGARIVSTGGSDDLLDESERRRLVALVLQRAGGPVDLVTADGASPGMDHDHLEAEALPLLTAQIDAALDAVKWGGSLVVKFFEGRAPATREQLWRVAKVFAETAIIKPTHSRPTNSERYLVARGAHCRTREPNREVWDANVAVVLARMDGAQRVALERALRRAVGG